MPFDSQPQEPRDSIIRTLMRAHDLLESGWCQGAMARFAAGGDCHTHDIKAVSYCLAGATYRAATFVGGPCTYNGAGLWLLDAGGGGETGCVSDFNDEPGRTKAEVLAVVRRAIEMRSIHLREKATCAA